MKYFDIIGLKRVLNKKVKNNYSETHKILKSPLTKHFHLHKTIFSVMKLLYHCDFPPPNKS